LTSREQRLPDAIAEYSDHQNVGVGFSCADLRETIETTEDAALNAYAFFAIFFETFGVPYGLCREYYNSQNLIVDLCEHAGLSVVRYVSPKNSNWVANQLRTEKLQWTGKEAFNTEKMRVWDCPD